MEGQQNSETQIYHLYVIRIIGDDSYYVGVSRRSVEARIQYHCNNAKYGNSPFLRCLTELHNVPFPCDIEIVETKISIEGKYKAFKEEQATMDRYVGEGKKIHNVKKSNGKKCGMDKTPRPQFCCELCGYTTGYKKSMLDQHKKTQKHKRNEEKQKYPEENLEENKFIQN